MEQLILWYSFRSLFGKMFHGTDFCHNLLKVKQGRFWLILVGFQFTHFSSNISGTGLFLDILLTHLCIVSSLQVPLNAVLPF